MTARLPFTQASVRRRIKAAKAEGLHVIGIRNDGTLILGEKPLDVLPGVQPQPDNAETSKWEDIEA